MRLLKVKINKSGMICITYINPKENEEGKAAIITVDFPIPPTASLSDAIANLRVYVADICEFPKKDADKLEMRGLTYSYHEKTNSMSIIFTALKQLDKTKAPLLINTPIKYDISEDELELLPKGCVGALQELKGEIETFMEQESEQMELFKFSKVS